MMFTQHRLAGGRFLLCRLVVALLVGLGLLGLAVIIALPKILPVFHFPPPSGPHAIGTLTYHWVDSSRAEILSTDTNRYRELMVQVWYPAKAPQFLSPPTTSPGAPYVQHADALAKALARLKNLPVALFGQLEFVKTHAILGASVADEKPNYPVLIFLEGAIGFRQMNTFQVEALVSQGYIVVAIDQPYTAAVVVFPDGREAGALPLDQMIPLIQQSHSPTATAPTLTGRVFNNGIVPYLAQDVSFTLDQLAVLNLGRVRKVNGAIS